ncbi:ribosomal protection-like ABC-F family protein [Bacillus massiliglaciei]|uniref:ribosomal protection-like ABC-F family protein n=1 Tax=Bacillus massiliglaciei TaxID=1816693 RepID=UPI000A9DC1A6|nr:ABC-F type ribosomal protection protein [Bacillus massiliglaciei]
MKELMKLSNISYETAEQPIFEQVKASVRQGEVIGIIGQNGAGKSTLMHLLHQDIQPSEGQILRLQQDLNITMVEQETESYTPDGTSPAEAQLLEKWKVPDQDYSRLSGGEKLKARLALGFSKEADVLLLDEPTNHLDEPSLSLLKEQIKKYRGTIVFVSHDRHFLDETATKIWSIEGKKLIEHKGNYTSYMEARRLKRLTQEREYEKQQKRTERIENQMKELTSWSNKAHAQSTKKEGTKEYWRVKAKRTDAQIKSKQKRLEKEAEKSKTEAVEPEHTVHFSMEAAGKTRKRLLEVKKLTKAFDGRSLFQNVSFTVQHGEKIAITGPNGSGKTTLLNILMGEETAWGEVWVSPSAKIGYLTQEVFDLPLEETPAQLFHQETFAARGKVQTLMKQLGFTSSHWTAPIRDMSMGERVKLKLMGYMLEETDALLLDEPTNHLDLPSREQLEETLSQYGGTLLVVSHDRYFLEKTTDSRLILSNQRIQKQAKEAVRSQDSKEELRLTLETERQAVLGKLSFLSPGMKEYAELDEKFRELTKQIKDLS